MRENKRYYVAYGSNLNVTQMLWRCPGAKVVGTAKIKDYTLLFRGSKSGSYLTIEPNLACWVPVAIWEVGEFDEKALDRYEGFPEFYTKKDFTLDVLETNPGRRISPKAMTFGDWQEGRTRTYECFAYIMRSDRPIGVPTASYLDTCREGYRTFGFDEEILMSAADQAATLVQLFHLGEEYDERMAAPRQPKRKAGGRVWIT